MKRKMKNMEITMMNILLCFPKVAYDFIDSTFYNIMDKQAGYSDVLNLLYYVILTLIHIFILITILIWMIGIRISYKMYSRIYY